MDFMIVVISFFAAIGLVMGALYYLGKGLLWAASKLKRKPKHKPHVAKIRNGW